MPIDRATFETGEEVKERRWKAYEKVVADYMQQRFGQRFAKRKITLGKPREFDLVSKDGQVLVQIKHSDKPMEGLSDPKRRSYFAQYMLDTILLERAPATQRLFVVHPEAWKDWFVEQARGIISAEVEVLTVPWPGDSQRP